MLGIFFFFLFPPLYPMPLMHGFRRCKLLGVRRLWPIAALVFPRCAALAQSGGGGGCVETISSPVTRCELLPVGVIFGMDDSRRVLPFPGQSGQVGNLPPLFPENMPGDGAFAGAARVNYSSLRVTPKHESRGGRGRGGASSQGEETFEILPRERGGSEVTTSGGCDARRPDASSALLLTRFHR